MDTPENQGTSTRPYLLRALHDWCTDNGYTPYIAVHVDDSVQVPAEYVKNNEIVLNVGFEATSGLKLGNEFIEFKARFKSVTREIRVPVDHVLAIYARENGQGMAFPMPAGGGDAATAGPAATGATGSTGAAAGPAGPGAAPTGGGAPRPKAAPARALRLAPPKEAGKPFAPGGGKTGADDAAGPTGPTPPTPPEPGAPRPSLKRIK